MSLSQSVIAMAHGIFSPRTCECWCRSRPFFFSRASTKYKAHIVGILRLTAGMLQCHSCLAICAFFLGLCILWVTQL